ncbi:H-NS family nucleoid-associated regulatory protein [Paraburkholderia madseniana]|uniref:H-NS family nucleoid-associated regulatory protein n=1 Tax=Paraburkholderia madseniana TaxID=2599607 RepID=UPI001F27EBD7|nr:H-NS family nucleoid-associated regulatory protein [Paraburkholderia madseniana]
MNLPSGLDCQRIDATLGEVKAIDTILHIDMCVGGNPHGAEAIGMMAAGDATKAKTAVKKASKSVGATGGKGQRKGPQPALYRDPKSGATWSRRGRAPAWLASFKDRSKYLIG